MRKFGKAILFFLMGLLGVKFSYGAVNFLPENIMNFFSFLFVWLPEGFRSGDTVFVVYFKVLLWFLIFAIMFWSAKKVLRDNKKLPAIVAFVISLTTVMLIPSWIITMIFVEYSAVVAVLLASAPIIIGFYLINKVDKDSYIRCIIWFLIGAVSLYVGSYFVDAGENVSLIYYEEGFYSFIGIAAIIGGIIAIIFALICFLSKLSSGDGKWGWDKDDTKPEPKPGPSPGPGPGPGPRPKPPKPKPKPDPKPDPKKKKWIPKIDSVNEEEGKVEGRVIKHD